jgi:catechol 2,3-dioxygenase-like lactoylglutathione lyase family enzyme
MFTYSPVRPTIPVVDYERAKRFYRDVLGLKVHYEDNAPGAVLQAGEATVLYIYQRAPTKADHTVAEFSVQDVRDAVNELRSLGVHVEDYDLPGLRTIDGVYTMSGPDGESHAAWFKDTEGNILAVTDGAW